MSDNKTSPQCIKLAEKYSHGFPVERVMDVIREFTKAGCDIDVKFSGQNDGSTPSTTPYQPIAPKRQP